MVERPPNTASVGLVQAHLNYMVEQIIHLQQPLCVALIKLLTWCQMIKKFQPCKYFLRFLTDFLIPIASGFWFMIYTIKPLLHKLL